MRSCCLLILNMAFVFAAVAETTRITTVVRTDVRSGKLVRGVVVAPRPVEARAISAQTVDMESAERVSSNEAASNMTDMIERIAAEQNVEESLVHSVIKAESNYNPYALSPKGAQGLMQLIPDTARRFGVKNSFNAKQNVEGGVRYLKFLLELYNNDYPKAIAAYNAGEGAVNKYGGIPPYAETRNYVYQVARNLKTARKYGKQRHAVTKPAPEQTAQAVAYNPIVAAVSPDGRVVYKTP